MSDSKPKDPAASPAKRAAGPGSPARRLLLQGAAAGAGMLAFPFVHAKEKPVLRYLGTAVNQSKEIADQFFADTGIRIQYIPVTTDDVSPGRFTRIAVVDPPYWAP